MVVFHMGTMYSGKTERLIKAIKLSEKLNMSVLAFKPAVDTKGGTYLKSRAIKEKYPSILIHKAGDITKTLEQKAKENNKTLEEYVFKLEVHIDEVQFLTEDTVEEIFYLEYKYKISFQLYGLVSDFTQRMFTGTKRIIELGAVIKKLTCDCFYCRDEEATSNLRTVNGEPVFEGDLIIIAEEDFYHPVCNSCYLEEKRKKEIMNSNTEIGI